MTTNRVSSASDGDRAAARPAAKLRVIAPSEHANERLADRAAERALCLDSSPAPGAGRVSGSVRGAMAPSSVGEELSRAGEPLERQSRRFFEARFGRDFSNVRIHRDSKAERSASAIGARAFTSGDHIVFGAGQWSPHSAAGMQLLAHELAHQAQRTPGRVDDSIIWRKSTVDLNDFDSGSFADATLLAYLQKLRNTGTIEDNRDSDDKARGVVRAWMRGGDAFALEPNLKVLLIKEMQSGFTGDDDERAILNLLEKSARPDVEAMFAPGQLDPEDLDSDFHGDEEDALRAFYDRLFVGGRKKALQGKAGAFNAEPEQTLGPTFSLAQLRAVLDEWMSRTAPLLRDREPAVRTKLLFPLIVEKAGKLSSQLSAMTNEQKAIAVKTLAAERAKIKSQSTLAGMDIASAATQERRDELGRTKLLLMGQAMVLDLSLQAPSNDLAIAAPSTRAGLAALTTPLDAATKQKAKEAIVPRSAAAIQAEARGLPAPPPPVFKPGPLPGEQLNYADKIKARIPDLIKEHHEVAKTRTEVERADPAKTRSMDDMQKIANQAKDEVDGVFGSFYDKGRISAFQGERRNAAGTVTRRGNLRDLWQFEENSRRADPANYEAKSAKFWLYYMIQNDGTVSAINLAHDAAPQFDEDSNARNPEATAIRTVGDPFVTADKRRLFEIGRGWDAYQKGRDVFVQLTKNPDAKADREFLWETYFTLIHEYIHKLADRAYSDYADRLGGESDRRGNTLIEGVDSLLSEIAWATASKNAHTVAVRTIVEPDAVAAGLPFDIDLAPIPLKQRYGSYGDAVRLVGVVGLHNLYAAYFKGRIDLIGGP